MPEGISVQELCERIERSVSDAFTEEVWVRGAISGISRSANGHVYFDLIESDNETSGSSTSPLSASSRRSGAVLPVALFAKSKYRVNAILKRTNSIRMTDGIEVQIRGQVTYYQRQSRVQLIMTLIDPAYTLGQLESARAQLLAALKTEGLLVANKRHRIPVLPLRVALITSAGSAAEADFVEELANSGYAFRISLFDTRVQGDEAVRGIASALTQVGQIQHDVHDVIVLIRGGGARTDLVSFDHGDVARAIATSQLPVIVGVGHEIDRSVADEVAHTSSKTPTASARVLIDTVQHFERRVAVCADRIAHRTNDHLRQTDLILGSHQARVGRAAVGSVSQAANRLERNTHRLVQTSKLQLERAGTALDRSHLRNEALDPTRALARGWSITRIQHPASDSSSSPTSDKGERVRSFGDIKEGTVLLTTLLGGTVTSTVTALATTPNEQTNDD